MIALPGAWLPPLLLLVAQASPPTSGPVDTIRQATWETHRDHYVPSPLCARSEATLWSCAADGREYALCASPVVDRVTGHLQYRASDAGGTVFEYPADKRPPAGAFTFRLHAGGDATVEFVDDGRRYTLLDALRGESFVEVEAPDGRSSRTACGGNQTLQLNYTLRLMYDAGLWER